jgi:flavin reductase (DIM6/NTAB) family NADH-FMN oxidoreductase RutF
VSAIDGAQQHFRSLFGHFPTGVAVVTGTSERGPVGMTANAVCSLSLDPLLVLVCFDNDARTLPIVRNIGREKFSGVPHRMHDGVPIIDGALAWMTCDLEQLHPGGDHTIGVGAVREMMPEAARGDPLVWYRGDYRGMV